MKPTCPCHSGNTYSSCCEPLHLGTPAPNAERLMRSRYTAYTLKLDAYLHQSWHSSTRPNDLSQADLTNTKWLGLKIISSDNQDATHATVEFEARFKQDKGKTQTLHETSRFVLEDNHWFYVDGVISN